MSTTTWTPLKFGKKTAANEVSYCPDRDGSLLIFGSSGSGKTELLWSFFRWLAAPRSKAAAEEAPYDVVFVGTHHANIARCLLQERLLAAVDLVEGDDTLHSALDKFEDAWAVRTCVQEAALGAEAVRPVRPLLLVVDGSAPLSTQRRLRDLVSSTCERGAENNVFTMVAVQSPALAIPQLSSRFAAQLLMGNSALAREIALVNTGPTPSERNLPLGYGVLKVGETGREFVAPTPKPLPQ